MFQASDLLELNASIITVFGVSLTIMQMQMLTTCSRMVLLPSSTSSSLPPLLCSIRGLGGSAPRAVRNRRHAYATAGPEEQQRPGEPVAWLKDATTYADAHSVVLDPTTKLPYQEKELKDLMRRTEVDAKRDLQKKLYSKKAAVSELNFDHIPIQDQVVLLFPGQGAQFVGMGRKLADSKRALAVFERASAILGYDLYKLCTEGPQSKLDQTLYCQPAVVVTSLAAYEQLQEREEGIAERCTNVAGFSVGEFAALVAAEVLGLDDAVRIVAERAAAMHECSQLIASGMATIRVSASSQLDQAIVEARRLAEEAGERPICAVANYLVCGVKVVGGSDRCLRFLEENANTFKFQFVKRLAVSGAFHTILMEGAVDRVKAAVKPAELKPAVMNVYSNYTGAIHAAKRADIRSALAKQVTSPVKWEQILQLLYRKQKDLVFPRFIECGPGKQLGAMLYATSKKLHQHYEHIDV